MASKETNQLRENELQALHHSIEQLNSGNSEVSFQNDSLENQKTSKRKRANQADVQTQTPEKSKRRNAPEENLSDPNNLMDEMLEVDAEESGADLTVQLTKKDVVELLFEEDFSSSDEETPKPSNDIPRVQQPTENILQTAISEIIGNQKSSSSGAEGGSGIFCPSGSGASGTSAGNSGGDDGDKPPSSPLSSNDVMEDDDEEEDSISLDFLTTVPLVTSSVPKGRSPAHRHIRHQRNAKRILDSWMADDEPVQPHSDAHAEIYFTKVKSRLEQSNPVAFKEMCSIMGQFQSSSNSFLELYRKIEYILKDNMDLLEEFILFLSPEAAALCGVQFQHFLYVRMREFFSKLKIHFKDSPSQLKRTLKTLQQVESNASPNINDIKNAILPLLKGNAHLTQGFLQLFPDDVPPPS
ncbi:uncharacterized protein LOC124200844 isoform X2 [Daphnia pulex]|uniref:uncharacterized protein LOC124200844 isoform X2 n=1 Tax=Daphnia pulex TaxID=6669 RepID=UPI001EDE37D7|nr:uncharacterized protein LOC124200844 isoform X2 [Daphnia pulex]